MFFSPLLLFYKKNVFKKTFWLGFFSVPQMGAILPPADVWWCLETFWLSRMAGHACACMCVCACARACF